MERDPAAARLNQRQRALVDYALKLTKSPSSMVEDDIKLLREAGLPDSAVHDAAAIAAYFNLVNRVALGLGVELEPES